MENQQFAKVGAIRNKIIFNENELLLHDSMVIKEEAIKAEKLPKAV